MGHINREEMGQGVEQVLARGALYQRDKVKRQRKMECAPPSAGLTPRDQGEAAVGRGR